MPNQKKDHSASGAAIAAGGGVAAGTGLAAGGIPGAKSDFTTVLDMKPGQGRTRVGRALNTAVKNRRVARAAPGGVLGFRIHAHEGGTVGFEQQAARAAARKVSPDKAASHSFSHGYTEGKIAPEKEILRHMKGGRRAAAAALIGGGGAVGYGLKRAADHDKKELKAKINKAQKSHRNSEKYSGALLGTGASGFGVSHGATRLMQSQERKWANRANTSVDEAHKLVPALGGRKGKSMSVKQMHKYKVRTSQTHKPFNEVSWPKSMTPERSISEIARDKDAFKGVDPKTAKKAGQLRGAAAQAEHFSHVYGNTGKVVGRLRTPSAIVAAAGAGGLAMNRKDQKVHKRAKPLMSDAEIKRRKKVQGKISRTTSTLGLTGLGLTAGAALAAKKPGVLRQVRKLPRMNNVTPQKMKDAALTTSLVSGGIGGVGGYNFAAYTNAESRKRSQFKKSFEPSPFHDGHYGSEGNPLSREEIESAFTD